MTYSGDTLYQLLPAIYRDRDAERGRPLRALLEVLAGQAEALDADIAQLNENWFIETCDEWVASYIGDLLRVRPLSPGGRRVASPRAYVANTLGYRRRKGTAAVLERLAYDVTSWRARAVEFFQLLATTQHLNHVRPANFRTPDLRDTARLDLLGGPFESAAHTADVRGPELGGRYDIPVVGLFLWRLQSYPVAGATACLVSSLADAQYTFSPLGQDEPLFNLPQDETAVSDRANEPELPAPLRRRALYDELEARRQAAADGRLPDPLYFGDQPVLGLVVTEQGGAPAAVPAERVLVCDLSDWHRPPTSLSYSPAGGGAAQVLPIRAAVDPVLGRITFPTGVKPVQVEVSYAYGFSGDLGGGPYDRQPRHAALVGGLGGPVTWQAGVTQDATQAGPLVFVNLTGAIDAWNQYLSGVPGGFGLITIMDSGTYVEDLTGLHTIRLSAGSRLVISAAGWPLELDSGGNLVRRTGVAVAAGLRPHIHGQVSVAASTGAGSLAALALDGLLLQGPLQVEAGDLGRLLVADCTLTPAAGGLTVISQGGAGTRNGRLQVAVDRSICGPLTLPAAVPDLDVQDSILEGGVGSAISAPGARARIQSTTVLGTADLRLLDADDAIFEGKLSVARRQAGCVRFSYLAAGSSTPRRYRCQPDLALTGVEKAQQRVAVSDRLIPTFTSRRYGDPGYAQLGSGCAEEIRAGSEDGAEMGAFRFLQQPQQVANLRLALDEYLRFGLQAGIYFVT